MKQLILFLLTAWINLCFGEIKGVIFDCHGVFFETKRREEFRHELYGRLGQIVEASSSDVFDRIKQTMDLVSVEGDESIFWNLFFESFKREVPSGWYEEVTELRARHCQPILGMPEVVRELQAKGFKLAMLSNAYDWQRDMVKKLGYYDLFPIILLSCEMGHIRKPDAEAYLMTLSRLNLEAGECLFIDDLQENIDAALRLGIDSILFCDLDQLRGELTTRGLLNPFETPADLREGS